MEPWFGEFQFAYGCSRELEDGDLLFPGWGMPTIPTQVQEKKLGYDVAFFGASVAPVFLQYKISRHLTRSNASEWGLFNRDYFRFSVYPNTRSPQHNVLVDLANEGREVYYCAPSFATAGEYARYHAARSISHNSVFIHCGRLPKNSGDDPHHLVYTKGGGVGYFHSDDERRFPVIAGIGELVDLVRQNPDRFLGAEEAVRRLSERLDFSPRRNSGRDPRPPDITLNIAQLSEFAMGLYGLALGYVRQKRLDVQGFEARRW